RAPLPQLRAAELRASLERAARGRDRAPRRADNRARAGVSVEPRAFLRGLYDSAVGAALPAACLPAHLPALPHGRTIVIGAGKAAAAMARVVEETWQGGGGGIVVTRYGHGVPCRRIEVIEAGHPQPDAAGAEAARRILALAEGAGPDDLVLCVLSGGGSALL